MSLAGSDEAQAELSHEERYGGAPIKVGQEWANALTHGIAAALSVLGGVYLVHIALSIEKGLAIACGVYMAAVFGTFLFSTLSHVIHQQPALNTLRAWDQAMIYTMISGTYTPIAYVFASERVRDSLLIAIWVAAIAGFIAKVAVRHRINSIGTWSYVLLGWLPAIPLVGNVPSQLAWSMTVGGIVYTAGILFLITDSKMRYFHAVWHVFVMLAAGCHFAGILFYVVLGR